MSATETPAPLHAPEEEGAFRAAFLDRSLPFLTKRGVETMRSKKVGIAGCGGVGGAALLTLARMGIKRFHLADPGRFDLPDLNRQWGATTRTLGLNKAQTYRKSLLEIDPFAEVRIWEEGIQPETIDPFLDGLDVVVDCLDLSVPASLRMEFLERAHQRGIFAITAPILGSGTVVACADPAGVSMGIFVELVRSTQTTGTLPAFLYEHLSGEHLDLINRWLFEKRTKVPSLAVTVLAAGSLVATETFSALFGTRLPGGRAPITLPRIILFDLFRMRCATLDLTRVAEPQTV